MKWHLCIGIPLWFIASSLIHKNPQNIEPSEIEFCLIDDALLDSGGVQLLYGIYFHLGARELVDSNNTCILAIADYLWRNPTVILEIGYHRDCRGSNNSSNRLSLHRARAICERLVDLGIDSQRLVAQGYGETEPVKLNGTELSCDYIISRPKGIEQEELHALNRRVEIKIISKVFLP